jgi:hypothetical protein
MVTITKDSVTVSDSIGEIVHWIEDEWIEDPSVTTAIANAINIYYTEGPDAVRKLIGL